MVATSASTTSRCGSATARPRRRGRAGRRRRPPVCRDLRAQRSNTCDASVPARDEGLGRPGARRIGHGERGGTGRRSVIGDRPAAGWRASWRSRRGRSILHQRRCCQMRVPRPAADPRRRSRPAQSAGSSTQTTYAAGGPAQPPLDLAITSDARAHRVLAQRVRRRRTGATATSGSTTSAPSRATASPTPSRPLHSGSAYGVGSECQPCSGAVRPAAPTPASGSTGSRTTVATDHDRPHQCVTNRAATYPPAGQPPTYLPRPGCPGRRRPRSAHAGSSFLHGVQVLERAQPGQRHRRLSLHGPVGDAQHLGRLGHAAGLRRTGAAPPPAGSTSARPARRPGRPRAARRRRTTPSPAPRRTSSSRRRRRHHETCSR